MRFYSSCSFDKITKKISETKGKTPLLYSFREIDNIFLNYRNAATVLKISLEKKATLSPLFTDSVFKETNLLQVN